MPTYEFRCPDGTIIERQFKMSEVPAEIPVPDGSGMAVRIVSSGAGLHFKGSGFYITDYGKDGKKDQRAAAAKSDAAAPADGATSGGAKPDGGKPDGSKSDGGKPDGGKSDGGTSDGGSSDAAPSKPRSTDRVAPATTKVADAKPTEGRKEVPKPTPPPKAGEA